MKKALFLIAAILAAFPSFAQLTTQPSGFDVVAFKAADLPIRIEVQDSDYTIPGGLKLQVWNNGLKLSDSTTVTVSGDTIKFKLTPAQLAPLTKASFLYLVDPAAVGEPPLVGIGVTVKTGYSPPTGSDKRVYIQKMGNVRVIMGENANTAILAANRATTQKDLAVTAKNQAEAALASTIATLVGRAQMGSHVSLRSNADAIAAWVIVQNGRPRIFYYDASDTTTPDDTAMTVVRGDGKRFKFIFDGHVEYEWFGVSLVTDYADETAKMMRAVNYLRLQGGGKILYGSKIYRGDVYFSAGWNISIEGASPTRSFAMAATINKFAVRIEAGGVNTGNYIKNITFYGADRNRHGLYLNSGTAYQFYNVNFDTCGIGFLSNGSISNSFYSCMFINNYLGSLIGTFNSGHTSIADINGQTVTITVAGVDIQPSEQNFDNCRWFVNKMHLVVDYPSGIFAKCANIKIRGGQMEGGHQGIYIVQPIPLTEFPLAVENVWFENLNGSPTASLYKGVSVPVSDIHFKGGKIVLKNIGIQEAYILNGGELVMEHGVIYHGGDKLHLTDGTYSNKGSFTGKRVVGDNIFLPHYVSTGINVSGVRSFGFYNKTKDRRSRAFIDNLVHSESHGASSTIGGGLTGAETITKVSGGVMDGTCWNVVLPTGNSGLIMPSKTTVADKYYVTNFNIKSTGSAFPMRLDSYSGTGAMNVLDFEVPTSWRSISIVGRGALSGTDQQYFLKNDGLAHTFQISGFQTLVFDTADKLYEFLESDAFTTATP